ncbi:DNA-protecting protein DprA, partial [Lactobacillus helveticus]|uniref:DNA-protecting protein DprA n=1 Tax=Lactobacillus helveticus TaxID=1587 RepID=UPI0021A4675D
KSGSLITASLGLQENRDIYAVPGPITSKLSDVCHTIWHTKITGKNIVLPVFFLQ